MTANLIIQLDGCEAEELHSLLSYWFEKDGELGDLILEATREVAATAKLVLMEKLGMEDPPESVIVLGNLVGGEAAVLDVPPSLLEVLKALEWSDLDPNAFAVALGGQFTAHRCPVCNHAREAGAAHGRDCKLIALISELDSP